MNVMFGSKNRVRGMNNINITLSVMRFKKTDTYLDRFARFQPDVGPWQLEKL